MADPLPKDQHESFWECVRIVCQRSVNGRTPVMDTTRARAMQVLDQLDAMKAAFDEGQP